MSIFFQAETFHFPPCQELCMIPFPSQHYSIHDGLVLGFEMNTLLFCAYFQCAVYGLLIGPILGDAKMAVGYCQHLNYLNSETL